MQRRNILKFILIVAVFIGFSGTLTARAASITIDTSIPSVGCLIGDASQCPGPATSAKGDIAASIIRIYQFAVAIAGIFAVGMIVAGSVFISASAGSPDRQSEGRDMITSAIWGIVLLFGSYLILRTINPRLVALEQPSVEALKACTYVDQNGAPCDPSKATKPGDVCKPKETACLPQQYSYQEFLLPGEAAAAALGSDAVNQALNSTDPKVQARVRFCTTLDPAPPPEQLQSCILRENCTNCVPFNPQLLGYMKPQQCRWGGEASQCLVNPKTNDALVKFSNSIATQDIKFQITEAFPPTVTHLSDSHYNGCAVDITVRPVSGLISQQCTAVTTAIKLAGSAGFEAGNEYKGCSGNTYKTTTGEHIHLYTKSCP